MTGTVLTMLYELGLTIIVASFVSELFKKFRLPGLIGAVLVGLFLGGPGGIGVVTDLDLVNTLALLGAILILFTTGLEFNIESFWKDGGTAFLLTTGGVIAFLFLGYAFGTIMGFNSVESMLLGVAIAPSGTSVIAHTLTLNEKAFTKQGSTILTACVIDDVEGILLLTLALGLSAAGTASLLDVARIVLFSTFFIIASIYIGGKVLPMIIYDVSRILSDEVFFAILLGFGLILAFIASSLGLAAITGAFIMGAIIPYKKVGEKIEHRLFMMKELFSTIFFTSIGLSIDPYSIPGEGLRILAVSLVAIFARFLGGLGGGAAAGVRGRSLVVEALGLSVKAEMSLIIAREAFSQGVVGSAFLTIASTAVMLTIIIVLPIFTALLKKMD
jgi:CPA2 family monovalent cation:H+ antiporter-2